MSAPLFSIVTVCLDPGPVLSEAIGSVLAQGSADCEYVVVDGGSTDGTLDVLRAFEPRFEGRLRWRTGPDEGLYDAMNAGLGLAAGEYVEFLGADDRLRPGALAAVARAVAADPAPDVVCGATHVFGPDGTREDPARIVVRRGLPARAPASHQSTFARREALLRAGGFDRRFGIAADYDLYLRLVEAGASVALLPDVLSEFRLGGVSTRNAWATAREYRDVRVAHGARPAVEDAVMLKSAAAATAVAAWMRVRRVLGRKPA